MAKVAIVTDSNSGITQALGTELGIFVLPMPFMIDDTQYFEDINLTQAQFYEKLENGANVITSQPSPEAVMNLWQEVLMTHDEIVHIPMSSSLSGSCQSAMMLAGEFGGKVQVVNNQRISVTQKRSCLDALILAKEGKSASEIKEILEKDKLNCSIYIMLNTLYYLKKGGRITPAAAAVGSLLKLKPVLQIQGEKLDAFAKARTAAHGKLTMIHAIRSDMESRFGGVTPDNVHLHIAYTKDREMALRFLEECKKEFDGFSIDMDPLSLSVSCHIGPGSLALACSKKLI